SVRDTDRFIDYLKSVLLTTDELLAAVDLDAWIFGPGLPDNCPTVSSARIERVDAALAGWEAGTITTSELPWNDWGYQERYRFLSNLNDTMSSEQLAELDAAWSISSTGNNEVLFAWLEQSIRSHYQPSYERLETFLVEIGRRKFLTPLYKAMIETNQKALADEIYAKARPNYHSVSTGTMDDLLAWSE
ncbi:MAG: aminopeptidase, partial [Flavobacteriales bacterium]|nr:aminopeptidase [Flavobacteriales bacterium]